MAELPRKTYAQLTSQTTVVDSDLLASYRSPGPLKSITADVLADYMRTKIVNADGFIDLEDYGTDGDAFREAIAAGVAAGKWVLVPAGTYTIDGAYNANGVIGLAGAGTVGLVCRDGWATFKLPLTARPGTITCELNSTTVTGSGLALFQTNLTVGHNLQNEDGEYIGKIESIESQTSLTLVDPAWRAVSGGTYTSSSEARAFVTQTNGANVYFENIEFDCAGITSNFGHKAQAAGSIEGTNVRYRYKALRFLDDATQPGVKAVDSWNIGRIETVDVQGHGITGGGDATTAGTGGGYIGEIVSTNMTKSCFNVSVLEAEGRLYVGRVYGVWNRWTEEGMPYPTQYATVRLGNGAANITIDYVYGEGMFRLIRLTDTDACFVNNYSFRDILGPAVLFNSKDQVSENSGVGIGSGIGPNRGNGRPLPGDEDGESISNPNEEAVVIAEGVGWGFGPATFASDEYIVGLGTITATSGTNTIVNRDTVLRGQDINCFDDLSVGDFLFNDDQELLGQVTAISAKTYWLDVQETTTTLTPSAADHASQTATLSGGSLETVTAGTGTIAVTINTTSVSGTGTDFVNEVEAGDTICTAAGAYVGRVASVTDLDTLVLVSPGAKIEVSAGTGFQIGSSYAQRTPDAYFYTDGGGLATVSGTAMTIPAPAADLGGTITTTLGSKTVSGQGTDFANQYVVGQHLFTTGDVSIGQIASITDADTLTLVANVEASGVVTTANFKYGYNFEDVLVAGDAIFTNGDVLIGEIASVNNAQSITLSATALTTITGAAYQFGRWKKTARGVEIAETAINSNFNKDDFWCQGAVTQYRLQQPAGIRPRGENTITKAQLATLDATERQGEWWNVSDISPAGWVYSNGTVWVKAENVGNRSVSTAVDFTVTYLDYAPTIRLSGSIAATTNITLSETGLPDGATFTFMASGSGVGSWLIRNAALSTIMTIRPGQTGTVVYDGSGGGWRRAGIAPSLATAARIITGAGTPEGSDTGSVADLYTRTNGGPGTALYVKESGAGTNTGWTAMTSALDAVYAESYGVSASNPSNLAAINLALDAANAAGKTLILPAGQLTISDASPVFNILDNTRIVGAGRGRTILYFTGLDTTTDVINVNAKSNVFIADLSLEASTLRTSGNNGFNFLDCVDCTVYRCDQTNLTQGFVFARDAGAVPPTTTNLRNKAIECVSYVSRSYGFFMDFATACEFINCEAYNSDNQDGFKTGGGSTFCKIIGCHSEGNAQDGFDTYDGFISSVLADCTAYNNTAAGFQIKGTLGGSYGAATYVDRESAVANCVAQGNTLNGFLFQEARQIVISGLISVENGNAGFVFNNCQQFTVTSCVAVRNTEHGFSLIGNTTRSSFAACTAVDNSYVDGTIQNGTYNGWNLDTGTNSLFTGCRSGNGTTTGFIGGQGYGYNTTTSTGNVFTGCSALTNVTGSITGTSPYTNNSFAGFYDNGPYRGWTTADAAGSLLYTGTIYRSATVIQGIGTGTPEGAVTGGIGSTFQRTDGGAGTSFYVKESGTGNTGWVAK